jgi:hypothetical protein
LTFWEQSLNQVLGVQMENKKNKMSLMDKIAFTGFAIAFCGFIILVIYMLFHGLTFAII